MYISAMRLVAPMTLVGLTALSVQIITKGSTPYLSAASAQRLRAQDVVLDGLAGVELHQGDVLVGGGVDDHLGLVLLEDGFDPGPCRRCRRSAGFGPYVGELRCAARAR